MHVFRVCFAKFVLLSKSVTLNIEYCRLAQTEIRRNNGEQKVN